jgi:hypothetical protein
MQGDGRTDQGRRQTDKNQNNCEQRVVAATGTGKEAGQTRHGNHTEKKQMIPLHAKVLSRIKEKGPRAYRPSAPNEEATPSLLLACKRIGRLGL